MLWITWHPLHDVTLGGFVSERDGGHHVGAEIDAEDGDRAQRKWNVGDDEEEEWRDFWNVARQRVRDGLFEIVEDQSTCSNNP